MDPWFGVVFVFLAFGGAYRWYFVDVRRVKRELRRARRFSLGELPEGKRARVVGVAQPLDSHLKGPITGCPCLYFVATVEEHRGDIEASGVLFEEKQGVPFVLDDGTERAIVDPTHARVALEVDCTGNLLEQVNPRAIALLERHNLNHPDTYKKTLRYREALLERGERVAILGHGMREIDPALLPARRTAALSQRAFNDQRLVALPATHQ